VWISRYVPGNECRDERFYSVLPWDQFRHDYRDDDYLSLASVRGLGFHWAAQLRHAIRKDDAARQRVADARKLGNDQSALMPANLNRPTPTPNPSMVGM
jgi:hypothetical protein